LKPRPWKKLESRYNLRYPKVFMCFQSRSDGNPKAIRAAADTTESAFTKAQGEVPANTVVIDKKELTPASNKTLTVEAFDEQSARAQAERQIGNTETIKTLRLALLGKKGFLGTGKKSNQYQTEVFQQAVVEVTYKDKAKISATIDVKQVCPECGSDLAILYGSSVGGYIKDYVCSGCSWSGPKCGDTSCDGYMAGRPSHGGYYLWRCIKCGWSGEGKPFRKQ
jgi:predicted RNA-binding Zn-ribbon protein involved in translation (DUF1610 family)